MDGRHIVAGGDLSNPAEIDHGDKNFDEFRNGRTRPQGRRNRVRPSHNSAFSSNGSALPAALELVRIRLDCRLWMVAMTGTGMGDTAK